MRRLYVGGLSHAVTQKELKDRFGKFGDVVDVELRTRRDEEGVPYKTFGYINISISDADLKRCLTVLNKSKWKGGTLQIETAKESFLHRLAQERRAADQDLQQTAADDGKQNLLDSLSKAGINNFTMRAAVPGTEVPGHKDWVVSKFGRVLPVLQLRCQKGNKAQMLKYDPSKYSHNIRKLDRDDADRSTPVSQLTWEVEGGDDDISRKRRGEFPSYEPRAKKSRPPGADTCRGPARERSEQNNSSDHIGSKRFSSGPTRTNTHHSHDSDLDSEEEICRLMAAQDSSQHALQQEAEESPLEVVGLEYSGKSGRKDDEDEYDSADTDELFASRRNLSPLANEKERRQSQQSVEEKRTGTKVLPVLQPSDEEEEDSAGSDPEYEAMFSNVTRLELSLADLQRLAEEDSEAAAAVLDPPLAVLDPPLATVPAERPAAEKGTSPEEILAAILEESDDDKPRKKKKRKGVALPPLPAFQGTRCLQEADEEEEGGGEQTNSRTAETDKQEEEKAAALSQQRTLPRVSAASEPSSCSEEEEERGFAEALLPSHIPSDEGSVEAPPLRRKLNAEEEEELQRKANLRRLSALQQRQREAEEQKKLIQGALANLDAPPPKAGKRIVFDSDEDDDEGESRTASSNLPSVEDAAGSTAPANQRAAKDAFSGPQLFDSSEDEDGAEEEDNRFDLRPQFEGQAGQKLMALQYRFGTDERFRMDERFLEEEEEPDGEAKSGLTVEDEALEEEKKNNLSILQNLLGSSRKPGSKTPLKAAKFRDVSCLHYDPSKEEHTAFETKTIPPAESKAARRKKREEAQKIPEVSSDIFYEVSSDLKAVFGQTKEELSEAQEENHHSWDQEDGGEEERQSSLLPDDPITSTEESSGFKFSFFGVDAETGSRDPAEYKVENIQAPKVSWQQDPRFHDSSSEEEEEEQEEGQSGQAKAEEPSSTVDLFFFFPGDSRLKDGPTWFCRSGQLEEQREDWEERRSMLRREVRKKHKDARRKLKAAPQS